ncbi:LuxR family transcriptional regulator, partial [Streptomyces sp. ZEA17I]|uniref:ATP-binding protein n=1 Tax=Streptomyces sp. ZEA17I TaxID=2202516 RepID=UPI000D8190CD
MDADPPTSVPAGAPTGHTALLDGLRDDLYAELDRRPALVVVTGAAGVGKSRLVRELLTRTPLSDTPALVARCRASDAPAPFAPLVEALARCRPPAEGLPPVT